jgi:DNA polymerase-3 subunit beta
MKFTASSTDLSKALSKVINVVPTKSTLPILENILLELSGNSLRITASDMELSISLDIQVNGMEDGKVALAARKFHEMVRALPQNIEIAFTVDPSNLQVDIETDHGRYQMASENPLLYPEQDAVAQQFAITLDSKLLEKLITKTIFAVSTEDVRPSMTGVLFQWKEGEFRAVATDGHRLVFIRHKGAIAEAGLDESREVIMPAKALNLLLKSLEEGEVSVSFGPSNARFTYGNARLQSKIIDERFPNYESVIPHENDKLLTVDRASLMAAVRRVAIFANAATHQVRISIENDQMEVSAEDIEIGNQARETLPCTFSSEGKFDIGFNARYIEDALARLDVNNVRLLFSSPTRGGIIRPDGDEEEMDILMLVMPLRLNS